MANDCVGNAHTGGSVQVGPHPPHVPHTILLIVLLHPERSQHTEQKKAKSPLLVTERLREIGGIWSSAEVGSEAFWPLKKEYFLATSPICVIGEFWIIRELHYCLYKYLARKSKAPSPSWSGLQEERNFIQTEVTLWHFHNIDNPVSFLLVVLWQNTG